MTEGATNPREPVDEGGDPACWAHLFADDEELDGALHRGEREGPANQPGGDLVEGRDE